MKNKILTTVASVLVFFAFTLSSLGQTTTTKTIEKAGKKPAKIEKAKVPKAVTETFKTEYPAVITEGWYGYPKYPFYNDWYDYNPFLFENTKPEYYVVDFTKDKVNHKAIYSKEGKKIAIHKKVYLLPEVITQAIKKGSYSNWKIATEKEKIFKDIEMDKVVVYKVGVEKGKEKHDLFYSQEGELLKDKTIK